MISFINGYHIHDPSNSKTESEKKFIFKNCFRYNFFSIKNFTNKYKTPDIKIFCNAGMLPKCKVIKKIKVVLNKYIFLFVKKYSFKHIIYVGNAKPIISQCL